MKYFFLLVFFFVASAINIITDSAFNYEISARVIDFLSSFTDKVSSAVQVPLRVIQYHSDEVNLTSPISSSTKLLYPIMLQYPNVISDTLISLSTGEFYAYSGKDYLNIMLSSNLNSFYSINPDGTPLKYLGNVTFNPHLRPWYIAATTLKSVSWVGPFIAQAHSNDPAITISVPIFRYDIDPKSNNQTDIIGVLAANIYLSLISNYLKKAYSNTDRNIYVVDSRTGFLIASTLDTILSYTDSDGNTVNFLSYYNIT